MIALQNPLSQPFHFLGLELAVAAAFALSLQHALAQHRRGDRWPLTQWLVAAAYGVIMELIAFNFFDNYDHGQFTVQLYRHKLPLYVVLLYPAFHYTGLKLIESWRLRLSAEALLVGLAIVVLDVPFDIAGPDAGWWRWSTRDPNLAVRWLGVPITSYYWYLLFGAIYAALLRVLKPRLAHRSTALQLSLVVPLALSVIVLGMIAFVPFHLLKAAGVPDSAIVAAHLVGCALLAWAVRPAEPDAISPRLRLGAALLHLWPVVTLLYLLARGPVAQAPLKLAAVAVASLALATVIWRRRTNPS